MHYAVVVTPLIETPNYPQMLFGCRPFGEGQSQEKVLHENTMLRATHVTFPAKPPVSNDSKVRACVHLCVGTSILTMKDHSPTPTTAYINQLLQEFIRACLTHSQADRPDVLRLCQHPYLRLKKL